MNRRLLLALAVIVVLAVFGAMKWVTRQRPVLVATVIGADWIGEISESEALLLTSDKAVLLDLRTGEQQTLSNGGVSRQGAWRIVSSGKKRTQLQLRRADGSAYVYDIRGSSDRVTEEDAPALVRASPDEDEISLFCAGNFYRWELKSRRFKSRVKMVWTSDLTEISRDGETVINVRRTDFRFISTRTGRVTKYVPCADFHVFREMEISPFGSYALYDALGASADGVHWQIVDPRTGRVVWKFAGESLGARPVFSPDETLVAFSVASRGIWEFHELKTGKLVNTLPRVPNATSGALSPDGNTLYSVTNGILYRQHAR